jgi:diguanylate cyclase (GGDEF)-like protein
MPEPNDKEHFHTLFDYAPISLWEEDYSGIRRLFDNLRQQGVESLKSYLQKEPGFVDTCMGQIKVNNINQHTLMMFAASSKDELISNIPKIFRDGMRHHLESELLALWNGEQEWSGEGINYTLAGDPLDILLHWRILPGAEQNWEQVLVSIEDITARKHAERRLEDLFEASPISLWEEDYSALKDYFDELRSQGVSDLRDYLHFHPETVKHCMGLIKVLNVNTKTLTLFGAKSKEQLYSNLDQVFRDEMGTHFARELIDLWNGKINYEREGINYALNGDPVNIHLDFRIMPGFEQNFGWALVAIQDISSRKKAEDYLRYLGTHDVMTGLFNRAYFAETLMQLENNRADPISVILLDLDGLKSTNDTRGHQAGDALIRRAAEVLKACVDENQIAARIGGDEFLLILPGLDEHNAAEIILRLQELIELNNKFYREPELSISIGAATSQAGISLENVIRAADEAMYDTKAEHHQRRTTDR